MEKTNQKRELFASHLGMLLACVGSAMGLANIWMFPARLTEFGGITFLIPYLLFLFGFSVFGLMGEYSFGKKMRCGPVEAFEQVLSNTRYTKFRWIGWFPVLALAGILSFYVVVIGWILRFLVFALSNSFVHMDAGAVFQHFAGTSANIPWTVAALLITALIVTFGIQKGIERFSTIMMATFYIVVCVIMVRALLLPNAMGGILAMLTPHWEQLLSIRLWIYALGMAFFTLSLGGAAMLVYGSYMPKDTDIPKTARQTAGLDFLASAMCALFTIPAAFSLGLSANAGPGLLFVTIPAIVTKLPAGYIFGVLFFLCAVFAAFTSSIVMLEVPVETLISRYKLSRAKAVLIISALTACISIPLNLDMGIFGRYTDIVSVIIFPLAAVVSGIIIFWIYGAEKCRNDMNEHAKRPVGSWFTPYMKYLYLPLCLIVLVAGIFFGGL